MNEPLSPNPRKAGFSWNNLSLRAKLVAILLLVALVPLVIIAYISDTNQRTSLTNDANSKLLSAADVVVTRIDTFINTNLNVIRAEGQAPAIVDYITLPVSERAGSEQERRMNSYLQSLSRQSPVYINSVAILDIKGITLADTNPSAIGSDRSNRYYFQNVISTGLPYASTMEYDTVTGRASLYFAAPIRNRAGDLVGVLRKRLDGAILQDFIISETGLAGTGSFAVLLDQNYVRLAHGTNRNNIAKSIVPLDPAKLAELQANRFMPPGTSEQLSTNIPSFKAGIDNFENTPFFASDLTAGGDLEQAAIAKSTTQPWYIIFAQPQSVFLEPITRQRNTNIFTALIIAVMVSVFGFFISQTISGPVSRLTQVAEAIAGGDINIQAKVETGDEIGTLANTFNRMTQQLRDFIVNLEARVAARTKDLATVAEVGTATSTILETNRLLQEVVNLTKERFNLYHSHIYLLDDTKQNLVLTAGAGEVGRIMVSEKRFIPVSREQSLVARAARERRGVIVNDVTAAPDFLANPLLPDTRAELAVPMIVGDTLLGVFDIQSEQVGRFSESDANIQTTLAAQIATSIQNARSYERSKAQADLEAAVNAIGQKIQRAASMEEVLQTAARELGTALGASRVSVNISQREDSDDLVRSN
jgi:putative methionine-R-sulfoxide reductase with GAF domain